MNPSYWRHVRKTDLARAPNEVKQLPEKRDQVGGVAADDAFVATPHPDPETLNSKNII